MKSNVESGKFLLLESRIQEILVVESRLLGFGIQLSALRLEILVPRMPNLESKAWNQESETVLDYPTEGKKLCLAGVHGSQRKFLLIFGRSQPVSCLC